MSGEPEQFSQAKQMIEAIKAAQANQQQLLENQRQLRQQNCPSCGYCPSCGRSNTPPNYFPDWTYRTNIGIAPTYPTTYPNTGRWTITGADVDLNTSLGSGSQFAYTTNPSAASPSVGMNDVTLNTFEEGCGTIGPLD